MLCFLKDVLMSMAHVTTDGHGGIPEFALPPEAMLMFMARAVARNQAEVHGLCCL